MTNKQTEVIDSIQWPNEKTMLAIGWDSTVVCDNRLSNVVVKGIPDKDRTESLVKVSLLDISWVYADTESSSSILGLVHIMSAQEP